MIRRSFPVAIALFGAAHLYAACAKPIAAQQVAAEAAYQGALLRCVDDARTLSESKACRAKVDAEWGIVQTAHDAGGQ